MLLMREGVNKELAMVEMVKGWQEFGDTCQQIADSKDEEMLLATMYSGASAYITAWRHRGYRISLLAKVFSLAW